MSSKLLQKKGFSLSEVMVSAAILILVTAAFATVAIMMRSLSNVKVRNVAYSIANDEMNNLEKNPSDLPDFVNNQPVPHIGPVDLPPKLVGTRNGRDITQTFKQEITFYPVDTQGNNLVGADGRITGANSRLVRVIVRITWNDYRQARTYEITQESFIRKVK